MLMTGLFWTSFVRVANLMEMSKPRSLSLETYLLDGANGILSDCKLSVMLPRKMVRGYLYELCTRSKVANQE